MAVQRIAIGDAYGLSKILGEEICRRYTRRYGLETVCLRYPWVFWDEHYRQIPKWQQDPAIVAHCMWTCIDVRDLARAYMAALKAPDIDHETILLSAARNFIGRPTVELVREYYGEVEVRDPQYFAAMPDRSPFRYDKAMQILGWRPEHDWQEEVDSIA